jgi:hypothetical protein
VDVFVMNFATHTVYDYAPGSAHPESAGTITVVKSARTAWAAAPQRRTRGARRPGRR